MNEPKKGVTHFKGLFVWPMVLQLVITRSSRYNRGFFENPPAFLFFLSLCGVRMAGAGVGAVSRFTLHLKHGTFTDGSKDVAVEADAQVS